MITEKMPGKKNISISGYFKYRKARKRQENLHYITVYMFISIISFWVYTYTHTSKQQQQQKPQILVV